MHNHVPGESTPPTKSVGKTKVLGRTASEHAGSTLRVQEIVEAARVRADALMAAHIDALIFVATAVYEKRRLSDDRLADVLVAAGFELPRPTA